MLKKSWEDRMIIGWMKTRGILPADTGKCVLTFGDWGNSRALKGNHCTKGKGLMDIFRRWGFWCFYVWEFRTSLSCSNCKMRAATTEYCKRVSDPKLRRKRQRLLGTSRRFCHGLIRCKECGELWNRDFNRARNIWRLSYHAIKGDFNEAGVTEGNKYRPHDLRRL